MGFLPVQVEPTPDGKFYTYTQLAPVVEGGVAVIRYSVTPRSVTDLAQMIRDIVAAYRYQVETGGCVLADGVTVVATDDRSKTLIVGAYNDILRQLAAVDADSTLDAAGKDLAKATILAATRKFKLGGAFVDVANETVLAIATAVAAHVQTCFDKEAEAIALIAAATFDGLVAFDEKTAVAWPANVPAPVVPDA